jgi:hypothetical protein
MIATEAIEDTGIDWKAEHLDWSGMSTVTDKSWSCCGRRASAWRAFR